METSQETVIDVQKIEPRLRHITIFQVFDHLKNGESFIIHNNHDPRPVYYQLQQMHGDIFDWEYLQAGPQWWDIRVTRRGAQQAGTSLNENGEVVINVPSIEPRLKHETIFQVFENLEPGRSLIIHNDHDPKPVYYQLLSEWGDIFTWQYLQQGPEWWDIRITRRGKEQEETIGQIAAKDLRKAEVFKKYGIDFCCGGRKTVRQACAEQGIDASLVEKELSQPIQNVTGSHSNYNEWSLDFLCDYIVNTHHSYVRKYLPELLAYATKVARVHGDRHPELIPIQQHVAKVHKELSEHLVSEESYLFPLVKKIVQAKNTSSGYNKSEEENFESIINKHEKEHESVGEAFHETRKLSNNYTIPADACTSYSLLFKMLDEFEDDLHTHIHLENNILFPKAIEMEKSIS